MSAETVDIAAADGVADAYLARPDDRPHPGVLFIMDAYGLRPAIEEMVDRIAADGYVVLAPNVFYRAGRSPVLPVPDLTDPEQRASFFRSVRPLLDELTPARIAADGATYLDYLADVAGLGPMAIAGYCMGGRLGWRIAAADRIASPRSRASMSGVSSPTPRTARIARPPTSRRSSTSDSPTRTRA